MSMSASLFLLFLLQKFLLVYFLTTVSHLILQYSVVTFCFSLMPKQGATMSNSSTCPQKHFHSSVILLDSQLKTGWLSGRLIYFLAMITIKDKWLSQILQWQTAVPDSHSRQYYQMVAPGTSAVDSGARQLFTSDLSLIVPRKHTIFIYILAYI